jgi:hypothetical protein
LTTRRFLCRLASFGFFAAALLLGGRASAQVVPPETTHGEIVLNSFKPTPELFVENVDFVTPLGVDTERFTEFRLMVRPGRKHKLRFSYVPMEYSEQGQPVQATVVFRNQTYTVNVPVDYQFKWELYRFGYEWDFLSFDRGYIGLIGELKYNKVRAFISSAAATADSDTHVPLPTFGGVARGYLGEYFSITGEFTFLDVHFEERRGKFYDVDIYGQLNFTRSFAVQGGFRRLDVDYRWDGDEGTFLMEGLYFGGTVRF